MLARPREPAAFRTRNPAHPERVVGEYGIDPPASVARAVDGAARAFRGWRATPVSGRVEAVRAWIERLDARQESIAQAIVLEQGKPLAEARGETAKALAESRAAAGFALEADLRECAPGRPGVRNLVVRRPRGVVAAMTPWNFPILTPLRKVMPALLAGNTVVLKPSELAPAAALLAVECARGILPEGVVQCVLGAREVGECLVEARGIAAVSFTGSVPAGRAIGTAAGARLLEQNLELGGKNGAIVARSADIGRAAELVAQAALLCTGQRCTAVSRAIVHADVLDEFIGAFIAGLARFRMGDGMDAATTMGPLTSSQQRERVDQAVARATSDGARLLAGGTRGRPPGCEEGFFFAPTLLLGTPQMSCARDEIFGPVVTVLAYEQFEDAIEILNGTDFGLAACLFSTDPAEIERFAAEADAGMLFVNQATLPDSHMPFVGTKASGIGPGSVGPSALAFATVEHSVYLASGVPA